MNKGDFYIQLKGSPPGLYSPGQTVRGTIVVATRKLINANVPPKIHVEVKGTGSVNWSEGSGGQARKYSASEVYVDLKIPVENTFRGWCFDFVGAGDRNDECATISHQRFPFEFMLPCNIPSSYAKQMNGSKGSVRYVVKAVMKRSFLKSDSVYELPFSVKVGVDLTEKSSVNINLCYTLRESQEDGQVKAEAWLDKGGYVPGDKVRFSAKIVNLNSKPITETELKFVQYTTLTDGSGKKWEWSEILQKKKLGKILPKGTQIWNNVDIRVPQIPPSRFPFCNIIDTRYVIELATGLAPSKVMIPVVVPIGTTNARPPVLATWVRFRRYLSKKIRQLRHLSDNSSTK